MVQKTLRIQPPAVAGFQAALQDFQYTGYSILKEWKKEIALSKKGGALLDWSNTRRMKYTRLQLEQETPALSRLLSELCKPSGFPICWIHHSERVEGMSVCTCSHYAKFPSLCRCPKSLWLTERVIPVL